MTPVRPTPMTPKLRWALIMFGKVLLFVASSLAYAGKSWQLRAMQEHEQR